jgi:hypothetical protein
LETVAPLAIVACLVALLAWTSRRWGAPRLYVRGVVALWIVAVLLVLLVLRLALG